MSRLCPLCKALCEQNQCPACGTQLLSQAFRLTAPLPGHTSALPAAGEPWQHSMAGRLLAGLVLAQGLAYALRLLCHAGLLLGGPEAPHTVWTTLAGLLLLQAFQALGLLLGGALAGAGQHRGVLLGSIVGFASGFVSLFLQQVNGDPVTKVVLYGQPVLHLAFGAVGGLVGVLIWKPLPLLIPATPMAAEAPPSARPSAFLTAPVRWGRVVVGAAVVLAGVLWPKVLLNAALDASGGKMTLNSHLQSELVTWEVSALVILLGAGLAGTSTWSGLKQGVCVAVGAGLCFLAVQAGGGLPRGLDHTLFTLCSIVILSCAGGWFGAKLFPPIASSRRGLSRVTL